MCIRSNAYDLLYILTFKRFIKSDVSFYLHPNYINKNSFRNKGLIKYNSIKINLCPNHFDYKISQINTKIFNDVVKYLDTYILQLLKDVVHDTSMFYQNITRIRNSDILHARGFNSQSLKFVRYILYFSVLLLMSILYMKSNRKFVFLSVQHFLFYESKFYILYRYLV